MTTALRHMSLEKRTQIGKYYADGLKAKDIAPLYGTTPAIIHNVIAQLRNSGVVLPFKNKRKEKVTENLRPELLILPPEDKVKKAKRFWSNGDKRRAYQMYRHGDVNDVAKAFNVSTQIAYYLIQQGRIVSGVKGKRNVHKTTDVVRTRNLTPAQTTTKATSENWGFFFLGLVVAFIVGNLFF